jgi:hypothetical protein
LTESKPVGNDAVVKLAVPPDTVLVASTVVPNRKETLPVEVPPLAGVTVATKVTGDPYAAGFGVPTTVVAVAALLTFCDTADDVLELTLESPE